MPIVGMFYVYKQLMPHSRWLDLNQREWQNKKAILYFPFKFCKNYIPREHEWLRWKVDEYQLSEQNKNALLSIRGSNTCFVHVRRGDYLAPAYKNLFEGCCDVNYYQRALTYMRQQVENVKFVCFSDNIEWAKVNLDVGENAIFVNWNTGTDSPLDMYLMTQCENAIIANSSFSYWGACLGRKKSLVVYPEKWWNSEDGNPDLFYPEWIKL